MKWSLAALAFGNFVIGTGTLIVPGLLPYLAESLGVSLPVAGHLITAFAVTICVAAPLLAGATDDDDQERKNKDTARKLGEIIGAIAKEKNIKEVVFDRGPAKYHGILAELADAARSAGLKF